MVMVFAFLSATFYDSFINLMRMWANPEEIINLINKICLMTLLASYFMVALLSKIRKLTQKEFPCLAWATTWNVRYIVKRAQLLDLPRRGE